MKARFSSTGRPSRGCGEQRGDQIRGKRERKAKGEITGVSSRVKDLILVDIREGGKHLGEEKENVVSSIKSGKGPEQSVRGLSPAATLGTDEGGGSNLERGLSFGRASQRDLPEAPRIESLPGKEEASRRH